MNFNRRTEAGFTLLEVMIALAVVAIALVALLGLANRSIAVNERIQRLTQGTLLAQQKLAEIEARVNHDTDGADESNAGVFAAPFAAYRWEVRYEDTPLASVEMAVITVAWGEEERNETVAMTSFLFR